MKKIIKYVIISLLAAIVVLFLAEIIVMHYRFSKPIKSEIVEVK